MWISSRGKAARVDWIFLGKYVRVRCTLAIRGFEGIQHPQIAAQLLPCAGAAFGIDNTLKRDGCATHYEFCFSALTLPCVAVIWQLPWRHLEHGEGKLIVPLAGSLAQPSLSTRRPHQNRNEASLATPFPLPTRSLAIYALDENN